MIDLPVEWDELERAYPEMLRECDARVVRWSFAPSDADWESPYPLWSARWGREPRRREVPRPDGPTDWGNVVAYGYDGDGAIVLARRFSVIKGDAQVRGEALWTTIGGHRTYVLRSYPPLQDRIVAIAVPHEDGGLLRHVDTWYSDGRRVRESYTYESERLTLIALDDGSRFRVDHDDEGALTVIWASVPEHDDGRESVAYRRKSPGDVAKARKEAEQLLYDGIRAWAQRQEVAGTVRVLVIGYDLPPNDVLPPPLALGQTEDAVVADVAGGGHAASLYSVADQGIFDPVPAELVGDVSAFQKLNQEWRSTSDVEAVRRLLLAVAKRLNTQDWSGIFPTITEDFAVVPVDLELTDLERNLRAIGASRA